jgi:hypothetical protein
MGTMKKILVLALFILSISSVLAIQPTQSFSKIFLNPFYRESLALNTNYTYSLQINPPDGISSVINAIVNFNSQVNGQTQTFSLWVNGKSCNTNNYSVATAFSTTGNVQFSFDCSNAITQKGTYSLILRSAVNTGAMNGWLDLTYMNNPIGDVKLHGTEYDVGQNAKLWLQLLNSSQVPITTAVCYTDIYTPTNLQYIERATMTNLHEEGIYYYDLATPKVAGVYPVIATCYYDVTQTQNYPNSIIIRNGTLDSGNVQNVVSQDGSYLLTTETPSGAGNPRRYLAEFYFNQSMCNISSALLTGLTMSWVGRWNSNVANDEITISIYNYTSNKWVDFPNAITGSGTGTKSVSNSLSLNNMTSAGLLNSSGTGVRLQFNDTSLSDTSSTGLDYDYLSLSCDQLGNPQMQQVKGSSEMHISGISGLSQDYIYEYNEYYVVPINPVTNTTYYTGYFIANFSIETISPIAVTNASVEVMIFHSIPCNSFQSLYRLETNGSLTSIPYSNKWHTQEGHCSINFEQTLSPASKYDYVVTARNTFESEMRSINTGINAVYPLVSAGCDYWALAHSETPYPYIVPKNQTNIGKTYFYRACANFYDDYFWFNQTYEKAVVDENKIVDENSFQQYEADYFSNKFASEKLLNVYNLLITDLISSGTYSYILLLDPLNRSNAEGNRFWANLSSEQINILLNNPFYTWNYTNRTLTQNITASVNINTTQIANDVWNSTNRTLTYYPAQIDMTNYTQVGNYVWNYAGNVTSTLLSQISQSIWSYVARYTHGEIV